VGPRGCELLLVQKFLAESVDAKIRNNPGKECDAVNSEVRRKTDNVI
jgi:hypothetical protein